MAMVATRPAQRRLDRRGERATSGLGRWKDFDIFMLITTMVLTGFGVVAIWSATGGGPLSPGNAGVKQALFGAIGGVGMLILASIDYRFFASLAWPIYGFGLLLLLLVLVPGIGVEIAGSRRWFNLGGFTTVQPSEFVKLATIVALAAFISSHATTMTNFGNFIVSLLIVAAPMALVFGQPDLGTSGVYAVIWASMMLVTRTHKRYFAAMAALAVPAVIVGWEFLLQDYQRARWLVFLEPESDPLGDGFNILQAEISIGSGGWWGYGLKGGTQSQLGLLKVSESDFIFSHASAMFGMIGMLALFACFVMLLWRCLRVVETAKDTFGQCLAMAITGVIFFQALVNISMNLGLMPVTGITLPFVSSGLSSLWTFLFAEGILQSILMRHRRLGFQPE